MQKIIENRPRSVKEEFLELYAYRSLIWDMAMRELKIRYAQTFLGGIWAVIKPLVFLSIYTFFFTIMMPVEIPNIPYPLLALSGIMGWALFMDVINSSGRALLDDSDLIKKNYFPLLVPLIYKSLLGLFEFLISIGIFFIIQIIIGHPFQWTIALFPFIMLLNIIVGFSIAIWMNILGVRVRDFTHMTLTLINFCFWLTPVFYTPELIPEAFRFWMYFNPMAGVIAFYRWSFLGMDFPSVYYLFGLSFSIILFLLGLNKFRKFQYELIDYL